MISKLATNSVAPPVWRLILSGIIFEGVWLFCVLAPSSALIIVLTLANLLFHLWLFYGSCHIAARTNHIRRTLLWLMYVLVLGAGMDAALFRGGVFISTGMFNIIPFWLAALWLNFAIALRFSLVFLQRNLWVAAIFGLVGGPLSYFFGARIGGQVIIAEPVWLSLGVLGVLWGFFLPLMAYGARASIFRL